MGCLNKQTASKLAKEPKDCNLRSSRSALACIVNSEIGAVLAVMRRNVRWGVRYADDDQLEHSLILSLKELRKTIFLWQHQWHVIDPVVYLKPFLDVIQSDETGAPITGVALSSVYKILSLEILDLETLNVDRALHSVVDAVTSCRFEVTDPASEEVVLMKILQVLLACMKNKASAYLSNHHVCNIVNTCFRIVHQAISKGELIQRIARHTMHEIIRCIFSHLDIGEQQPVAEGSEVCPDREVHVPADNHKLEDGEGVNSNGISKSDDETTVHTDAVSGIPAVTLASEVDHKTKPIGEGEVAQNGEDSMMDPYGVPCMLEIFHFLCSLLNMMEHSETGSRSNPVAYDEDVPLFALGLINTAIELGGASFGDHPKLLALMQEELFYNLMQFGLSMSPLILSTVCNIVLNLYHHLRTKLKVQLEAFFSRVLLRVVGSKHGSSYQLQEVAMEALVDFCRQPFFVAEMYANFDCDISCSNVFEDLANLLSKSAFPVNSPLSTMNTLSLDGLIAMIQGMAERVGQESSTPEPDSVELEGFKLFWTVACDNYCEPCYWVPFIHKMKKIKQKLMMGADHFNQDPKKGLEFLKSVNLLLDIRDAPGVAHFLRYTNGLDKNAVGDFLGSHDEFCIQVLNEFARSFDFRDMNLDTALRIFLGTFRLPGESQKIQRVLEAFAERYYEQSQGILVNKDAALVLSYSLILLNTDRHNAQVKKKMTEEDFIRNNRRINGGNDLPRDFLSELYHSICENEIRMVPEQAGAASLMTRSHWIGLVHRSKQAAPFIFCDFGPYLDYDMFAILSGQAIAAISVVFDHVEQENVWQTCIDGYLSVAKLSACYGFIEALDDLVVSLCRFTTLLHPSSVGEKFILAFGDDAKARMATVAVFTVANRYGDHIRSGWKNILDCILSLNKLGLLSARLASEAADGLESHPDQNLLRTPVSSPPTSMATSRKSVGLIGRFSQLLYLDTEEPEPQPTEEQVAARMCSLQTIHDCHIGSIFAESKFLQAESLSQLVQALLLAGRFRKASNEPEDELTAVFCLELLIAITLNNRDRIMLIWSGLYEHIGNVVQSIVMPCALVEKAAFGLLRICQRLLPYRENLTDELLKSLQLILKLDARVADAYCEHITQEVMLLVKVNAMQIRSHRGWRTIISLLSITARHPEASEAGFETLSFIMSGGAHVSPENYVLCVNAARQFAESRVGDVDRSVKSLDLMGGSLDCLVRWFNKAKEAAGEEASSEMAQDIWEMWLRLVQGLRKVCVDRREEVRNHAILILQRCFTGVEAMRILRDLWLQCFDVVIFPLLDDLIELVEQHSMKDYRNMEATLILSLKLLSKVFSESLEDVSQLTAFSKVWLGVVSRMERYTKAKFRGKRSEKIHELVPELLKNTLLAMKSSGILVPSSEEDSIWQKTWSNVKNIDPSLQLQVFPSDELEQLQKAQVEGSSPPPPPPPPSAPPEGNVLVSPGETTTV